MARTPIATDAFTYSNGNLATVGSTNWAEQDGVGGYVQVASNKIQTGYSATSDACWKGAGTFSNDQYAKIVVTVNSTDNNSAIGVSVRNNGAAYGSRSLYRAYYQDTSGGPGQVVVQKIVSGGTPSNLSTITSTFVTGDVLWLECVTDGANAVLRVYKNDAQIGTDITDSTSPLTTGKPGICAQGSFVQGDDWEGGDVSTGVAQDLAGAATGGGTAAGAATVTKPLAGGATGSGTAAGAASVAKPLGGGAQGGGSAAGAASVTKPLGGTAQGAGSAAGELASQHQLTVTLYQRPTPGAPADPLANATGLWWAWWSTFASFLAGNAPTARGSGASTDANGVFLVQIEGAYTPGADQGFGVIGNLDATPDLIERAYVGTFDVL